jgi:hypothetical protein
MPLSRFPASKATQLGTWTSATAAEVSRQLGYRAGEVTAKRAG